MITGSRKGVRDMVKQRPKVMMCDRIEDGHICVLVGRGGERLSVPMEKLTVAALEKDFYLVEMGDGGSILLTPAPKEKKRHLKRILALRQRLLGQNKHSSSSCDEMPHGLTITETKN